MHFAKVLFKKAAALLLCAVMALSVTGCGSTAGSTESGAVSAPASQAASAPGESLSKDAIQLVDQAGRTVTLDKPAQTLVSCYYITTYATIALGIDDRVVGLEKKADSRPIYKLAAPQLLEKPQVGSMKEFNVEAAAALEPDLVLMPKKLADHADTLTQLGIPVLVVDPENQEKLEEMLTLIAKACGAERQLTNLLTYYMSQQLRMDELTADVETPSVYMAGNSGYLQTATAEMYQNSLIQQAGGVNAAADIAGDYWQEVSYESLLAMAPDVIILPVKADYTVEDVLADPQLKDLPAVQNKAVYQMPKGYEEWDSPVPSGVLGALWMLQVLHPEVYTQQEFIADRDAFYQQFYGVQAAA